MLNRKLSHSVIAGVICLVSSAGIFAQPAEQGSITIGGSIGLDAGDCETVQAELGLIAEAAGENKSVIIIARLGNGEFSRQVNRRRLRVGNYFTMFKSFPKRRVIVAEGERTRGLGQIEFYVGGQLFRVFKMKNAGIAKGVCETAMFDGAR